MIEVVTHPARLAGAQVDYAYISDTAGVILLTDRDAPESIDRAKVHIRQSDCRTRHMMPAARDLFRALLEPDPNADDVDRALTLIDAAIPAPTPNPPELPPTFGIGIAADVMRGGGRVRRQGCPGVVLRINSLSGLLWEEGGRPTSDYTLDAGDLLAGDWEVVR